MKNPATQMLHSIQPILDTYMVFQSLPKGFAYHGHLGHRNDTLQVNLS